MLFVEFTFVHTFYIYTHTGVKICTLQATSFQLGNATNVPKWYGQGRTIPKRELNILPYAITFKRVAYYIELLLHFETIRTGIQVLRMSRIV